MSFNQAASNKDKNQADFITRQEEARNSLKFPQPSLYRLGDPLGVVYSLTVTADSKYIIAGSDDRAISIWSLEDKKLVHRFTDAHAASTISVAVTRDMRHILSGSEDNSIAIWDIEAKKLSHRFENAHKECTKSVTITRDDKFIISGSYDKTLAIWDLEKKTLVHRIENAHQECIMSVVVTRDDKYIVSASKDKTIAIWDIENRKLFHRFEDAHQDVVQAVAVSEDNKCIVSGSDDKTIAIWGLENKSLLHRFENAHLDRIRTVFVIESKKKNYFVSGGDDKNFAIWDLESKQFIRRRYAHNLPIWSVVATGDSKYIISGSTDESIAIWDFEKEAEMHRFQNAHQGSIFSLSPRSGYLFLSAASDNTIALWGLDDKKLRTRIDAKAGISNSGCINAVTMTKNCKYAVSVSSSGIIAVWEIYSRKLEHQFERLIPTLDGPANLKSVVVTDDSRYILTGSATGQIYICDIVEKKVLDKLDEVWEEYCVRSVAVTTDGNYAVSGGDNKTIAILDIETKKFKPIHKFKNAHAEPVLSVSITRDNKFIASSSADKTLAIWSLDDKKLVHRFQNAHQSAIRALTITEDSVYLVSGSGDKSIAIWSIEEKNLIHRFENTHQEEICSIAVTRDNRYILSGSQDQTIAIWDIVDKTLRQQFEAHCRQILSVKVTRDNKYVVSGAGDKTIAIWNTENKALVHKLENAHEDDIMSVTVSRDNKYIVSGSADKTIAIWDFETKSLIHKFHNAHKNCVFSVTVSEDSKHIVSGSGDQTIAIWSIHDKILVHQFENAHKDAILSVTASADDMCIVVSGSRDKTIAFWDLQNHKLIHRIQNAHQSDIWSVAVARDSKHIVSGSADKSIGIWGMEKKNLLYRFENAHGSAIYSLAVTEDSRYIISGSEDETVAIWDIEDKRITHRYQNVSSKGVHAVTVTGDNMFIISGGKDNIYIGSQFNRHTITFFDIQTPLTHITDLLLLNSYSKILAKGFDPKMNFFLQIKEISFLHEMRFLRNNWNFLHFAVFLLPNVRPADYLNFAQEQKIYISLDTCHKTPVNYMLDFPGKRTPVVSEFCSLFFKQMSSFMNLDSFGREKLLNSLVKLTVKIYKTQTSVSLLGYLKCFVRPAEQIFGRAEFEKLPNQGNLRDDQNLGFIKLKKLAVPSESEYYSVISKPEDDSEANNDPTLQYELVLLPLDYYGNSTDTFHLLNVFESFEVEDSVLYEDPTVSYLIDFLWEKLKGYLYFQVLYFATNTALYTLFGVYYQDGLISSPILIIVIVMNVAALVFEGLQATAGFVAFLGDPWNYFEIVTPLFQIVSAILYWTVQGSLSETIFISTSVLLLYTKFLITMRVFDPLRHMIRMILEILSDSKGFMIVIFTYALGLTIAVYHNREVQQDSDGSGIYAFNDVLMEMYAFAIGSWSYTEYAGVNIGFFLFASFLLPLVLLNMLIALMGDTYARVQDNRQAFDSRERVLMLYELVSTSHQFTRLMDWIRGRKLNEEDESDVQISKKERFYLLVVKEFSVSDDQIDLKIINNNQIKMRAQMEGGMSKLNDKIDDKVRQLNIKIDDKISALNGNVGSLSTKMDDTLNSLNTKIDDKIGSLDSKIENMRKEIVSEILMAFGKKPSSSFEKDEGQKIGEEEKSESQEIVTVKDLFSAMSSL